VQEAKRLIDRTSMTLAEIGFAAGFGSVRRFNDAFAATYRRPPSSFRRRRQGARRDHPTCFLPCRSDRVKVSSSIPSSIRRMPFSQDTAINRSDDGAAERWLT